VRAPPILTGLLIVASVAGGAGALSAGNPERGKLLMALAGGCGCHNPEGGPVGAGGRPLPSPFGTFYSTNITPDADTGIGAWTDEEIIAAIRTGDARGKGVEAPAMPYYQYAGMADRDARDLVAYLRTLTPVRRENRAHEVGVPFERLAYRLWRMLFTTAVTAPSEAPAAGAGRGAYLARHVAICGDCHTPRTRFGASRDGEYLAGTADGPLGEEVPNITPDPKTGIGDWDVDDIAQLLASGFKPDFDNVQGLMAEVIDGYGGGLGYAHAAAPDLRAIAEYLKTVPPVRNRVARD
jgi:mono/diheme cytochrome c family protein